jgi:FKBP-type peptidyl-prolyl cis-trans isomerase FklB
MIKFFKSMKKKSLLQLTVLLSLFFVSCSETDNELNEFSNWKDKNEKYFTDIYFHADSAINNGSKDWKIIREWSLENRYSTTKENNIVVNILKVGNVSACPIYTDSVRVHIQSRLIPSSTYSKGYSFWQSFDDKLDITTSLPFLLSADGTIPSGTKTVNAKQIDGLSTALQQMHLGDRWVVYVPHQYGYGTVNNSSPFVPAYSTLIFDITLVGIYHSGDRIPKWN